MTKTERQIAIIKTLSEKGSMSTADLSKCFEKSTTTINADLQYLSSRDKIYFRRNETGIRYVVLIPDNCRDELYKRVDVGAWIEAQKKGG